MAELRTVRMAAAGIDMTPIRAKKVEVKEELPEIEEPTNSL
jgi:hypothetical protein